MPSQAHFKLDSGVVLSLLSVAKFIIKILKEAVDPGADILPSPSSVEAQFIPDIREENMVTRLDAPPSPISYGMIDEVHYRLAQGRYPARTGQYTQLGVGNRAGV